eukprot:7305424-Pyramimonas_sp.AAC.1
MLAYGTYVKEDAWCLDVSQSVYRLRYGSNDTVPTICPKSKIALHADDPDRMRLLTGLEYLMLHGFDFKLVDNLIQKDAFTD